jgi:lysine-specific demethylase 8
MHTIPARDRAAFNALFVLEHYFPKGRWIQSRKAVTRRRAVEHVRRHGAGNVTPVERVGSVAPEEFRKRYLARGVPVILDGGASTWPLASRWTFAGLRERYGREMIKLVQRKGVANDEEIVEGREFSEEIQFGAFLDQVVGNGKRYMRFSPLLERFPELLDDFDHDFFKKMSGNNWGLTYQMFIGGSGSYTPLHNAMTSFFFVNVCGTKRWALIPNHYLPILNPSADGFGYNHSGARVDPPNAGEFPGLECIDRLEAVMQPGDVLFVPSWMWHCVRNDSPTIGVRCGFVYPLGMMREAFTLSFIRLFAARNPSTFEALYYTLFRKNLPERDKWLLTARLIRR